MDRTRLPQYTELKPYDINNLVHHHGTVSSKKWWLGFCFAVLGILLLLYVPVYHQLQTRIGETLPGDLVAFWYIIHGGIWHREDFFFIVFCVIVNCFGKWSIYILFPKFSHVGIPGWNFNTSRDMRQYILPDNTTAVQQPTHLCSKSLFLLIIVCSAVDNFESRNAIRQSWGSENIVTNFSVKVTFLLGQTENQTIQTKLYAENQQYDDIIQERFIDSYNNLTLKSVMLLKWVNNHCTENVKFVMKTDDDMFVNVPPLVKLLKARIKPSGLLIGYLFCGARPVADTKSKWYAPKYMYPDRIYPNYLSGTGYVMSSDTVTRLYKAALSTPLFHLEDIYITGMCARVARIRPQNHPGFSYQKRKFDQCVYKDIITSHRVTPKEMHKMFNLLRQPEIVDLCKEQLATTPLVTPSTIGRRKNAFKRNNCS